jgi:hypothetical protein
LDAVKIEAFGKPANSPETESAEFRTTVKMSRVNPLLNAPEILRVEPPRETNPPTET